MGRFKAKALRRYQSQKDNSVPVGPIVPQGMGIGEKATIVLPKKLARLQ
jgi:hypothetical protein